MPAIQNRIHHSFLPKVVRATRRPCGLLLLGLLACAPSAVVGGTKILDASQDVSRSVSSIGSEGTVENRSDFLQIRSYEPGGSTVRELAAYIQFDLSSIAGMSPTGHSLTLHVVNGRTWTGSQLEVFGLASQAGYTTQNWTEGTVSFGGASDEFDAALVDGGADANQRYPDADFLGALPARGSADPTEITFSSAALDAFIANRYADNKLITLIIANAPGANRYVFLDSRENGNPNVSQLRIKTPGVEFTGRQVTQADVADTGSSILVDIANIGATDWAVWRNTIGAPSQQRSAASAIGDLQAVGSPGGPNAWEFMSFSWGSLGAPTAGSTGYAAGVSSQSPVTAGEGYRVDVTLPQATGTITFWGVTRNARNVLSIEDENGELLYTASHQLDASQWDVTTFTLDWTGAADGQVVSLKWLYDGVGASPHVGLAGISVDRPDPFFADISVTPVAIDAALLTATLFESDADTILYWGSGADQGTDASAWENSQVLGTGDPSGTVYNVTLTNLQAGANYSYRLHGANDSTSDWTRAYSFTQPLSSPPVELEDNGDSIALSNGLIDAQFSKTTGRCEKLTHGGANLLAGGGTLYLDSNTGGTYFAFNGSYSVVENASDRIHIIFAGSMGEFDADLHYVMNSGESGFHSYVIFRHGPGKAATYMEQARMVLRCDPDTFVYAFSSTNKTGQMIAPSLLSSSPTIMDATHQLPAVSSYTNETGETEDGFPTYSKYDWSDTMEDHKIHGLSSDTRGLWMISGSEEYMNGGPSHAELIVHGTSSMPLMIQTFHSAHFLGSDSKFNLTADESWSKVYGPYFIFANTGSSSAQVWRKAQEQADQAKAAWPPAWMNESEFPLDRGTVNGTLRVENTVISNALIVLAEPGQDWQLQGRDYIFWSRTDASGNFSIPKVRPGAYSLYAVAPGFSREYELPNVTVTASSTTDIGFLNWKPRRGERQHWMVGVPDRSTRGFGYSDRIRQYGLWWRYLEDYGTDDLVYTVGESALTDWCYALSQIPLDGGVYHSPEWHIDFNLTTIPAEPAILRLDIAGAKKRLNVSVNGTTVSNLTLYTDSGLHRSAVLGSFYQHHSIEFDTSLLVVGANRISFGLNGKSWSGSKPAYPNAGVMWDSIALESGPQTEETIVLDSDRDSLDDAWEREYFGDMGQVAGADLDFDGFSNLEEYIAGTHPNDINSRFEVKRLGKEPGGGFTLKWDSGVGRTYNLLKSVSLSGDSWVSLSGDLIGTGGELSFTDSAASSPPAKYYKLQVILP
jgi:rhamnogalacturonan endolyase